MAISVEYVLTTTIDFIRSVVEEYKAYKQIDELKDKLDLYISVLEDINSKFTIINEHFYPDLISEHKTAKTKLEIINNELVSVTNDTLYILNWMKIMDKNKFKQAYVLLCPYFIDSPTKMKDAYTNLFEQVKKLLDQVNRLIDELYGTTLQFKNDILRKCWILCGKEHILSTAIPKIRFTESVIELVKKTYTTDFNNNKTYILNAIIMFVDRIDGCMGTKPDEFITKFEINEYSEKLHSNNLNDILSIDDKIKNEIFKDEIREEETIKHKKGIKRIVSSIKNTVKETPSVLFLGCMSPKAIVSNTDDFDNISEKCESSNDPTLNDSTSNTNANANANTILFDAIVHVDSYDDVIIPQCSLTENGDIKYGSDWPSKVVLTYKVDKKLSKIRVKYTAHDQGWGGTGHASVRYQINTNEPVPMNFLQFNKYEDNKYLYDIVESFNIDDVLTIYLVCPSWNGWSATIKDVNLQLYNCNLIA